jgi:hypothetical protein
MISPVPMVFDAKEYLPVPQAQCGAMKKVCRAFHEARPMSRKRAQAHANAAWRELRQIVVP